MAIRRIGGSIHELGVLFQFKKSQPNSFLFKWQFVKLESSAKAFLVILFQFEFVAKQALIQEQTIDGSLVMSFPITSKIGLYKADTVF
jgi:hypothetical protein